MSSYESDPNNPIVKVDPNNKSVLIALYIEDKSIVG